MRMFEYALAQVLIHLLKAMLKENILMDEHRWTFCLTAILNNAENIDAGLDPNLMLVCKYLTLHGRKRAATNEYLL